MIKKQIGFLCATLLMAGCSVFGHESVETAQYKTISTPADRIEIRNYAPMVIATSSMKNNENGQNDAFQNLFDYISGENTTSEKVAMTAPVLMNKQGGEKIAMTAPVFMDQGQMSFVLPSKYTFEMAPKPTSNVVTLKQMDIGTVAAITFKGTLDDDGDAMTQKLVQWIEKSDYAIAGKPMRAGYNPPWTLPAFRRNEILIPVEYK